MNLKPKVINPSLLFPGPLTKLAINALKTNVDDLAKAIFNYENDETQISPTILATCVLRYLHDLPPDVLSEHDSSRIKLCLDHRFQQPGVEVPPEVQSLYAIMVLDQTEQGLYQDVRKAGPKITSSTDTAKSFLNDHSDWSLDENQVCGAVLLMTLIPDREPYNVANFIAAVEEVSSNSINWTEVIALADRETVMFTKAQFLGLFNALLPISKAKSDFDIQSLWRGPYKSLNTHLTILSAFLACSPLELDVTSIPDFRPAYNPSETLVRTTGFDEIIDLAKRDTMISSDAVTALLNICVPSNGEIFNDHYSELTQAVGDKVGFFLCSASCIEDSPPQFNILRRLVVTHYLKREQVDSSYVLQTVWKHSSRLIAHALMEAHVTDPLELSNMLDLVLDLGWLEGLLTLSTGFAFDLAALAHRKGLLDFSQWAEEKISADKATFTTALYKFAVIKAQDELRVNREEQEEPRTITLSMQTAYDLVAILEEHMADAYELKGLQRTFLQAYPRLILLCEGITDHIDVDCKSSNAMPKSADLEMQDLYKRMYGKELDVNKVIEYLQECKQSDDASKKDLFACMVHGLFDEYSCFSEYPIEPLSKTAVLFGGIIEVGLISDLTLRVAREMVLDALKEYSPNQSMFKFGMQAAITFLQRLHEPEWTDYCRALIQIPALSGTQVFAEAQDSLTQQGISLDNLEPNGINGPSGTLSTGEGMLDEAVHGGPSPQFTSIAVGPEPYYEEPDEKVKDTVVFFFNNVSQQNLNVKFETLRHALNESHHGWFADFLVNGRAKVEPNYQPLYLEVLRLIGSTNLSNEVLRSTYFTIQKTLNAESTMHSATERKNIKSLAIWLGSLTLAQDKPIKRKDVSFVDLLLEGYEFQKLLIVIPFICNVMAQGQHSAIFRPPNPWVAEVLSALKELYDHANITTNQKFDIEVLCDELSLKIGDVEPSSLLIERAQAIADRSDALMSDGLHSFEGLPLGGINGNVQNPRFDVSAMQLELPDLERVLKFPPANGSAANQNRLKEIVIDAVTNAIYEIIGSVVERSVTVASRTARDLIHKDFSCEQDEDKLRSAAHIQVRELARSLALVTSKDPLKTSMNNHIRKAQAENPLEQFPEGTILMCINDNLDAACEIVEAKAADQAGPEIDDFIKNELEQRERWRIERPGEPYVGPAHNNWATAIPAPYKLSPNGLTPEQSAVYETFGRQPRGLPSHAQSSSADSGRQVPDILQDTYSSGSHIPGVTDTLALGQHGTQHANYMPARGRILPAPLAASANPSQINGYSRDHSVDEPEVHHLLERVIELMSESEDGSSDGTANHLAEVEHILEIIMQHSLQYEQIAMTCAETICKLLYEVPSLHHTLVVGFASILATLFHAWSNIAKEIAIWTDTVKGKKLLRTNVTAELLRNGILQSRSVDESLATLIESRDREAAEALSGIVHALWQAPQSPAFRADFARSLGALAQWKSEGDDGDVFPKDAWNQINRPDAEESAHDTPDDPGLIRRHLVKYIFSEWVHLCEESVKPPNDKLFAAFAVQTHVKNLLRTQEDVCSFLKCCIDAAIIAYDLAKNEEQQDRIAGDTLGHFDEIDWLARLVVLLVRSQGEVNGQAAKAKITYMDSVLSMITLIINDQQVTREEHFNQRIFFRLLSTILCEWYDQGPPAQNDQMILVFAENFLLLEPKYFPGMVHGWLMLVSHRHFLPYILNHVEPHAQDVFARIMEAALSFVSHQLRLRRYDLGTVNLYQALLRILLLLHHDYPTFLADTHFKLCNAVHRDDCQLLNLILSACPPRYQPLPNPFVTGLKVDRLEEIREQPRISVDFASSLVHTNIKSILDSALRNESLGLEVPRKIIDVIHTRPKNASTNVDSKLIQSIVLYIGESAIMNANPRGGSTFVKDSTHVLLLRNIFSSLNPEARYFYIFAMVNQLRWQNAHTHFFAHTILHFFSTDPQAQEVSEPREYIIRVLMERIHAVLPHPWGLIVVLLELLKNPLYGFWQLPWIKSNPQVSQKMVVFLTEMADHYRLDSGRV